MFCIDDLTIGNKPQPCTGQDKCYDTSNDPISCPTSSSAAFFGQDAYYAANGYCAPRSFEIHGSGSEQTVYDTILGLEWQQTIPTTGYTWANAVSYCNGLTYAGYDDWRLPTPNELFSMMNNSTYGPATYTDYFTDTSNDVYYWTSKQYSGDTSKSWLISIRWGYTSTDTASNSQDSSSNLYKVRCVRGSSLPDGNFSSSTVNGNVIVTDSSTGLIWTKTYPDTVKTWQEALDYCENLTYAGFSDWRLPNKDELISLVNYGRRSPASNFPGMPSNRFWTSSSRPNLPERAFDVSFTDGEVSTYHKTDYSRYVRCVR